MKAITGRSFAVLFVVLLSISSLTILNVKAEPRTLTVPDDYPTIQEAINNANNGDTIFVKSGTYHESISIDKSISLIGENPESTKIIGDYRLNGTIVLIQHNYAKITGFTLQPSAYSYSRKGIHLLHVTHCNIIDNNFFDNGVGVWLYESSENEITGNTINGSDNGRYGILAEYSPNNMISNNQITDNDCGISLYQSEGNTLHNNTIKNNNRIGLNIISNNNKITDNIISNQKNGITLYGSNNLLRNNKIINSTSNFNLDWNLQWDNFNFENDIDSSNTINGNPIIYWINKQNEKVPEDIRDISFLILVNCTNITVENLKLSKNEPNIALIATTNSTVQNNIFEVAGTGPGILLFSSINNKITNNLVFDGGTCIHLISSSQNTITKNSIINSTRAIKFEASHENIISNNVISGNKYTAIDLDESNKNKFFYNTISNCEKMALWFWNHASQNQFYLNNFINNTKNVEKYITDFQKFPINILNNGSKGNYWSDYTGNDNDGDGIGDIPYIIEKNNQDNYPLMSPIVIEKPQVPSYTNPTPTPQPEPSPTTLVLTLIAIIAFVGVGIFSYRIKTKRRT